MHLCLHSASKRRKNYNDLKCCGGESCTFSSLKNHPKATQSKNANFIFDSNWRYQKPKPENAREVFWCVARRRQMEKGCPWRPSFSEGSYIFQCYPSSSVWSNQRCMVHRSGWVLRILEFSLSLPFSLSLSPFLFSLSLSLLFCLPLPLYTMSGCGSLYFFPSAATGSSSGGGWTRYWSVVIAECH